VIMSSTPVIRVADPLTRANAGVHRQANYDIRTMLLSAWTCTETIEGRVVQ
jgi:hypothetical protein